MAFKRANQMLFYSLFMVSSCNLLQAKELVQLEADGQQVGTIDLDDYDLMGDTYNDMIIENAEKDFKTVVAVVRTGDPANPFSRYYHSSSILSWLFRGDNPISPSTHRYMAGEEVNFKDPTANIPLVGKVYFFEIGEDKQPHFIGTDEDLHREIEEDDPERAQKLEKRNYLKEQIIKNYSDEMLKPLFEATAERILDDIDESLNADKGLARKGFAQDLKELKIILDAQPEDENLRAMAQLLTDYILNLRWAIEDQNAYEAFSKDAFIARANEIAVPAGEPRHTLPILLTYIKFVALLESGTIEDIQEARELLVQFKQSETPLPAFMYVDLINLYFYGIGGPKNYEACKAISDEILNRYPENIFMVTLMVFVNKYISWYDTFKSAYDAQWYFSIFNRFATQNDNLHVSWQAKFALAQMWLEDNIISEDETYINLLRELSEQSDELYTKIQATYWLGELYRVGEGLPAPRESEAKHLLDNAFSQNYLLDIKALAAYSLGRLEYTRNNLPQAKTYLEIACQSEILNEFSRGAACYWVGEVNTSENNQQEAAQHFAMANNLLAEDDLVYRREIGPFYNWFKLEGAFAKGILTFNEGQATDNEDLLDTSFLLFDFLVGKRRNKALHPDAHYYLGRSLMAVEDKKIIALSHLYSSLKSKDNDLKAKAQYYLAQLYSSLSDEERSDSFVKVSAGIESLPEGTSQSIARDFYEKLAREDSALVPELKAGARYYLGVMLLKGIGGGKDTNRAREHLSLAAEQTDNLSLANEAKELLAKAPNPGAKKRASTSTQLPAKRRKK